MSGASVETGKQGRDHHECPINGDFDAFLLRIQSPALQAVARSWHEARGDRLMPSWTDVAVPSPYSKLLWSFAYNPETGDFTCRSAAAKFSKWAGGDIQGKRLPEIYPPSTCREIQEYLTKLVTTPLAVRFSGRLFMTGDLAVTGERIALPLAADGMTADGVLGASDYVAPPLLGPFEIIHENLEWYTI